MARKLFAFRVAKPIEVDEEVPDAAYDPEAQTLVWRGEDQPLAVFCSTFPRAPRCRIVPYGGGYYCSANGGNVWWGSYCDYR